MFISRRRDTLVQQKRWSEDLTPPDHMMISLETYVDEAKLIHEAVKVPPKTDLNDWLASNTVDFYRAMNMCYHVITRHCTETSCPYMNTGPRIHYAWQNGSNGKYEVLPAPDYVDKLVVWISEQLGNHELFPQDRSPSGEEFTSIIKKIVGRIFRVYAHIYYAHFDQVQALGAESHLNTCFHHFFYFVKEFDLIKERQFLELAEATSSSPMLPIQNTTVPATDLHDVSSMVLYSEKGDLVPFKTILHPSSRTLVIFIRHFFCSMCQDYTRTFCSLLSEKDAREANVGVVIIGCGAPSLIPFYAKLTSCPFPIYTNPSSSIYRKFGMYRNIRIGPSVDYAKTSIARTLANYVKQAYNARVFPLRSGGLNRLGGEFILATPGDSSSTTTTVCEFAHRMKNARDHTDPHLLRGLLLYPSKSSPPSSSVMPSSSSSSYLPNINSNNNNKTSKSSTSPRIAAAPTSPSLCYLMDNVPRLPRSSSTSLKFSLDNDNADDNKGGEGVVAPVSSSIAPTSATITGTNHKPIKATFNIEDSDDGGDDGLICGDLGDGDIACSYFESSTLMIPPAPVAKTASSSSLNPTA